MLFIGASWIENHPNTLYLKTIQTPKMMLFVEIVNGFKLLITFAKISVLDAWLDSEYISFA